MLVQADGPDLLLVVQAIYRPQSVMVACNMSTCQQVMLGANTALRNWWLRKSNILNRIAVSFSGSRPALSSCLVASVGGPAAIFHQNFFTYRPEPLKRSFNMDNDLRKLGDFMVGREGFGPTGPTTNPYNLRNNCVFVTMASLMNMSLDDFLNHIETMQPAWWESGIPNSAILQMLKDTKKRFDLRFTNQEERALTPDALCLKMTDDWRVYRLGVCYSNPNAAGHCILFERTSDDPPAGFFRDLQIGESKVKVPDGSSIALIFTVRPYS